MWLEGIEPGYILLNRIVGHFTYNYQIFISVIAIVSIFAVARFIYKYSCNVALSSILFFLMFYGTYTNTLRQIIAMSLMLWGFDSLGNNRYVGFIIKICLAILFHRTAFIAFALLLFWKRRSSKRGLFIVIIILAEIGVLGRVSTILSIFGISTSYTEVQSGASIIWNIVKNVLLLFAVLFIAHDGWSDETGDVEYAVGYQNLLSWIPAICIAIGVLALGMPAAVRFDNYFSIFYIVCIPFMMKYCVNLDHNKQIVTGAIIAMLIVYTLGSHIYRPEWSTELNYHFYWEKDVAAATLDMRSHRAGQFLASKQAIANFIFCCITALLLKSNFIWKRTEKTLLFQCADRGAVV